MGDNFWCADRHGYVTNGSKKHLHCLIVDCPEGMTIDHINCNPLDNRKSNLRICTLSENCCNKKKSKRNTSGYKGVTWHKRHKKWYVSIRKNDMIKHIGCFLTKEEAHAAYCKVAKELHGEFARFA